ncbi:hypothetical protein GCM10027051_16150 [Niabella terrae]
MKDITLITKGQEAAILDRYKDRDPEQIAYLKQCIRENNRIGKGRLKGINDRSRDMQIAYRMLSTMGANTLKIIYGLLAGGNLARIYHYGYLHRGDRSHISEEALKQAIRIFKENNKS